MRFVMWALGIPACLGLGYFVYQESLSRVSKPETKKPAEAFPVEVTTPKKTDVSETVKLVGHLEPIAQLTIRARIAGYITRLPKELGEKIEAGKLAVELDNSKHLQAVDRAAASSKIAAAQLKAAETRKNHAAKEVARLSGLTAKGGITKQQLEAAQATLDVAAAEVELEQARVDAADADLKQTKLSLSETSIVSSITGVVANRLVEVGDLANPADPLVRIVELTKVRLNAAVVERDYQKVKPGQKVEVRVDAFPDELFTGHVDRVSPVIDTETQTAIVHIEIDNPGMRLKEGMMARGDIILKKRKGAIVVLNESIIDRNGKDAELYVVEGSPPKINSRIVQVGIRDGDVIEILNGIGPDSRVVTLGSRLVKDGQIVTPVEVPFPQALAKRIQADESSQTGD